MKRYQPALLGGLFIGVLSSLPVVGAANLCCCLWVVTGGVLTVYLQQQGRPEPVETADAVLAGLLAGLIGAAITTVVQIALYSATGEIWQEQFRSQLEANPEIPPRVRDALINLVSGRNMMVLVAAVSLPVYAVFGMLGALLGLAFFRKKVPPAPQA
jgi:hypothetical protein